MFTNKQVSAAGLSKGQWLDLQSSLSINCQMDGELHNEVMDWQGIGGFPEHLAE